MKKAEQEAPAATSYHQAPTDLGSHMHNVALARSGSGKEGDALWTVWV